MFLRIRRFIAIYIDLYLSLGICYYQNVIVYNYVSQKLIYALSAILGLFLFAYLIIKKDCLFGYESIGKKIMFLKIYRNNERVKDKILLANRIKKTACFFVSYPFMIIYNNKSKGDITYNTEVK